MKHQQIILFLACFFCCSWAFSQQKIAIDDATKHIGDSVTICSKIYGGKYFETSKSKVTLLNVGAAYPNALLTIVIEEDARKNFTEKPEEFFLNKEVCVSGVVKEYKGKPQIIITKPEEIIVQKKL
ncbi:MAG: hypothetical protein ACOVNY_10310 [Chitinophagaceae bacterium]|jgi:DNA/RNA endonuclease YhcR with UshA esterase domain